MASFSWGFVLQGLGSHSTYLNNKGLWKVWMVLVSRVRIKPSHVIVTSDILRVSVVVVQRRVFFFVTRRWLAVIISTICLSLKWPPENYLSVCFKKV